MQWLQKQNFHLLPLICVGARVALTRNLDLRKGATNGAVGTVVSINFSTRGKYKDDISSIVVQLDCTGKQVSVYRSVQAHRAFGTFQVRKQTFPLQLAYAMTAHKAQGHTIKGPCILHMRKAFTPGLLYVMLSRVTTRAHLTIVGDLNPSMFIPVPCS